MHKEEHLDFTIQLIKNIMANETEFSFDTGKDWTFEGLKIISKYTSRVITNAHNGKIFSDEVKNLIHAGIGVEDFIALARYGYSIESDILVTII